MRHVAVAGDTYTILVSGAETAGHYCLIDVHAPADGEPPPHRHDFEEMFNLLEGEPEFTFRGKTSTVRAGSTVNIPAHAPHAFKNASSVAVRMLCMAAPAGLDEFFLQIGDLVDGRTTQPPKQGAYRREGAAWCRRGIQLGSGYGVVASAGLSSAASGPGRRARKHQSNRRGYRH